MAFQEAGDRKPTEKRGLPMHWEYLKDNCCPICGEELTVFDHLDLWKCACGFKISGYRLEEIKNRSGDRIDPVFNGFGYSKYQDDSPF